MSMGGPEINTAYLGLGLVTQILQAHDDAFVYAAVRNPDNASALKDLEIKYPTRIAVVKCLSADIEGNTALAKEIEKRHARVDTVVANAGQFLIRFTYVISHIPYLTKTSGICDAANYVSDVNPANLEEHFHVCLSSLLPSIPKPEHNHHTSRST